jgi:uncharacterized protein
MITAEIAHSWYPESDAVHGFDHILRVYRLAERIAGAEGADLEIVRVAALLHDAQEQPAHGEEDLDTLGSKDERSTHHHRSADFARQVLLEHGWSEERIQAVLHCIRAHRYRDDSEQPQTLEAKVLFDADKLDAIGAVGVARAIVYAVQVGEPAYAKPSALFMQSGKREPGERHSAYHEYIFKLQHISGRLYTSTARKIALERHQFMIKYFTRLAEEWES